MNVTLIYQNSKFNVDILEDTPCQFLFNVVNKIFQIPISQIKLTYEDREIKNNSRLLFSVMRKTDKDNIKGDETIIVERNKTFLKQKSLMNLHNITLRNTKLKMFNYLEESTKTKLPTIKNKKKGCIMKCQICNLKNSIFYCRVCNLFVCFECNVRFNEHKNHERINLEDGDSFLGSDVYREEIINEINVIELGYQQTLEWMIDNQDREDFLQSLFKSLEQIRAHSLNLAEMKTLYSLDQEIINDFKIEVDKIPKPGHREELLEIFGNLNLKENELRNYTKFLNLQIIKTEYNKVLLKCLDIVKKNIDQLGLEVKARLAECEDIKFRNIEDIKLYLKESKFEKNKMFIKNYLSKQYNNNPNNNINLNTGKNMLSLRSNIIKSSKKEGRNNYLKDKEGNKTADKKMKHINLINEADNIKNKIKIQELNLVNNFSSSNIKKKRELLVPLKINKKKEIKNTVVLNEISNIEKPKNLKKRFNTKQELSEADFQDFPLNIKKNDNNNNDKRDETTSKDETEDKEMVNVQNEANQDLKNNQGFQNIDLSKFIGIEKKIYFKAPSKSKDSYGKTLFNRRKPIFENKD